MSTKKDKNFQGHGGFAWWTGIVEDRIDPLKVGRVRIRMFGWHGEEKSTLPSEGLLWAQPVFAANINQNTHVPKEGEMVFGFFVDGEYAQVPFYVGIIPNIPNKQYPIDKGFSDPAQNVGDRPNTLHSGQTRYPGTGELNQPSTSRSARHENMDQTPFEKFPYKELGKHEGKYPYINSLQTESGHYFDLDDTKDKERITLIHRSGSFIEFNKDGDVIISAGEKGDVFISAGAKMGKVTVRARGMGAQILEDCADHYTAGYHVDLKGTHCKICLG